MPSRGVAELDGAEKIDVDLAAPFRGRGVLERLADRQPGIVHQNIEAAEVGDDLLSDRLHGNVVGNIGPIGLRLAALGINFGNDCRRFVGGSR